LKNPGKLNGKQVSVETVEIAGRRFHLTKSAVTIPLLQAVEDIKKRIEDYYSFLRLLKY
jgi:hypothetical protein